MRLAPSESPIENVSISLFSQKCKNERGRKVRVVFFGDFCFLSVFGVGLRSGEAKRRISCPRGALPPSHWSTRPAHATFRGCLLFYYGHARRRWAPQEEIHSVATESAKMANPESIYSQGIYLYNQYFPNRQLFHFPGLKTMEQLEERKHMEEMAYFLPLVSIFIVKFKQMEEISDLRDFSSIKNVKMSVPNPRSKSRVQNKK